MSQWHDLSTFWFNMIDRRSIGTIRCEDLAVFMRSAGETWAHEDIESIFDIFKRKYDELIFRRQTRMTEWKDGPDATLWFFVMCDHVVSPERQKY